MIRICRESASEDGVNKECILAGDDGLPASSAAGDSMKMEELARIIKAFYALP